MHHLLASFTYTPVQRWGPVSPHGVGTALGFFLGAALMARRAEPRGIPKPETYNAVTWGALGAIIGARGFYIIGHWSSFTSVGDMLAVWRGGLTMFGGFFGGLVLGLGYLRRHGYNIPVALDAAAPGFVVGVLIGRIGDLIIADHLGRPTHFFLGYKIPNAPLAPGYGPPTYIPGAIVHHTALYDFAGALLLLGAIYVYQRRKPPTGALFALFGAWYGLQRFFIDFTRNRTLIESHFFGLSGSQWAGLLFAVGGVAALVRMHRNVVTTPEVEAVPITAVGAPPAVDAPSAPVPAVAAPTPTHITPTTPPPVITPVPIPDAATPPPVVAEPQPSEEPPAAAPPTTA